MMRQVLSHWTKFDHGLKITAEQNTGIWRK